MFRRVFILIREFLDPLLSVIDWSKLNKRIFIINYGRFMLVSLTIEVLKMHSDISVREFGRILDALVYTILMFPILLLIFGVLLLVLNTLGFDVCTLKKDKFFSGLDFLLRECYGLNIEMFKPLIELYGFDDDDSDN